MSKRKTAFYLFVSILGLHFLFSCEKVTLKEEVLVDSISFAADIKPIFSNCTGCHLAGGKVPNLKDNPYTALKDGGFINITKPAESKFYVIVTNGGSHKQVSPVEKQKILLWITQGAKNN